MFKFVRNSVSWMSVIFIVLLVASVVYNLFTNIDNLLFEALVIFVTWLVFSVLGAVAGLGNGWCYRSVENLPQTVKTSKKTFWATFAKGSTISLVLFGILALMTTPVLPVFAIEFSTGFALLLAFCWVFVMFGYYSILKKLLK